ncbi:MAG: YbaK/EbsC family protein [Syntrophobacteraceae bacterium]|nr:YbaK/EbsC family protein [Syntrophobacteraceae bacterium]
MMHENCRYESVMVSTAYERVMEMLREAGAPFTLHEHPPVRTIEEAHRHARHLTHHLLKTVVFKIKDGPWILAAVEGGARIDYRGLASAFSVKRTDLRTVSPPEVERSLGFQVGGVGPFAIWEDVEVVLDESVADLRFVFCGSGLNTRTIEMAVRDLASLPRTRFSPIARDRGSPSPA